MGNRQIGGGAGRSVAVLAIAVGTLAACTGSKAHTTAAANYSISPASMDVAALALAYVDGAGAPILTMHKLATDVVNQYTPAKCQALTEFTSDRHKDALTTAAFGGPDPVLTELVVDEIHAVATIKDCGGATSVTHLADVERLLGLRLKQIGAAS